MGWWDMDVLADEDSQFCKIFKGGAVYMKVLGKKQFPYRANGGSPDIVLVCRFGNNNKYQFDHHSHQELSNARSILTVLDRLLIVLSFNPPLKLNILLLRHHSTSTRTTFALPPSSSSSSLWPIIDPHQQAAAKTA